MYEGGTCDEEYGGGSCENATMRFGSHDGERHLAPLFPHPQTRGEVTGLLGAEAPTRSGLKDTEVPIITPPCVQVIETNTPRPRHSSIQPIRNSLTGIASL